MLKHCCAKQRYWHATKASSFRHLAALREVHAVLMLPLKYAGNFVKISQALALQGIRLDAVLHAK